MYTREMMGGKLREKCVTSSENICDQLRKRMQQLEITLEIR